MSVIRSTTSFTREEFEQIRNTPPADHTELRAYKDVWQI